MKTVYTSSIFRSVLLTGLAAATAFFCAPSVRAATITFTNTQGTPFLIPPDPTGVWTNAANWSPNQVPGTGDDVIIATNATVTTLGSAAIAGAAGNISCASLTNYGFLTIDGSFSNTGPTVVCGGGTIWFTNTVVNSFAGGIVIQSGGTNMTAYTTREYGDLTINPGATYLSYARNRNNTTGVQFNGNVTNNGIWNAWQEQQSSFETFLGPNNTIVANNTMYMGCGMQVNGNYTLYGTVYMGWDNSGTCKLGGSGSLTNMGTIIFNGSGYAPLSGYTLTLNCSAVGNTFDWLNNNVVSTAAAPPAINYYNLILGNTFGTTEPPNTWILNGFGLSVSGTLTINGLHGVTNWPSSPMTFLGLLWNANMSGGSMNTNPDAINMSGPFTLGGSGDPLIMTGVFSDGGNGYSLTKVGKSQVSLMPSAVETYTGNTVVNGGTLTLDYSQFAGNQNNLVNSGSRLIFGNNYPGGGALVVSGAAGLSDSQTFNGLTLTAGGNTVSNNAIGTATTIALGTITRGTGGGTVNFASTGDTTTGPIKTATGNNAAGILGGWGVVNGTDWAANDGSGNIVAYSGYTSYDGASGSNPTVNYLANDGTPQGNFSGTSLKVAAGFNIAGGNITLASGNSGGLLCSSSSTIGNNDAGNYTIGAGAGNEFLVNVASGQTLSISGETVIGNNSGGLTKAGSGTLFISSASPSTTPNLSYTGPTIINNGVLALDSGVGLASSSITVDAGATLSLTDPLTLSSGATLTGSGMVGGTMLTLTNGTIYPGGNGSYGTLTFANGLTLSSNATVVLDLDNPVSANNDLIVATNGFTAGNATLMINPGPHFMTGTYVLVTVGANVLLTDNFNTNVIFTTASSGASYTAALSISSNLPPGINTFGITDPTSRKPTVQTNAIILTVSSYMPYTMPTVTLGANPSVPSGSTSANLTYSATTFAPNSYSIVWSAAALTAGFVNVTNTALPGSPIVLAVPAAAPGATYSGTLTVQNAAGGISAGTPFSVTVIPPVVGSLIFTQQPPASVASGTVVSPAVAVEVLDPSSNPISGVVVSLMLSNIVNQTVSGIVGSQISDASGVATFSGLTLNASAGSYALLASVGSVSTNSTAFSITAGTGTSLIVTLPGQTFISGSGNSGSPSAQTAGISFGLTLTAVDSGNNIATSYSGTKTVSYSGPNGSPTYTTSVTFSGGQAMSVATTLKRAETTTITASISGLNSGTSSSLTVNPGAATMMIVTLPGQTFISGSGNNTAPVLNQETTRPFSLILTAVDAYTNIVTSYSGTMTISYSGPSGSPIYTTNVTFSGGQATAVSTILVVVETTTISATDGSLTGVPSSPLTVVANLRTKADNVTVMQDGPSWVEGTVPGAYDVALFNNIYYDFNLSITWGGSPQIAGIKIVDPGYFTPFNVQINMDGGSIILGTNGIDMSTSSADLTLNQNYGNGYNISPNTGVTAMPWNITNGTTLTIYGKIYPGSYSAPPLHSTLQVTKLGGGTVVLDAPNNIANGSGSPSGDPGWGATGFLKISQGIVQANNNCVLGDDPAYPRTTLILDGGTFMFGNSMTLTNPWPVQITTSAGSTIDDGGNTAVMPDIISDFTTAGVLIKAGSGTLTLTATNTYSGGTVISNGTLEAGSDGALGLGDVMVVSGTTLQLDGGAANNYIYAGAKLLLQSGANPVNLAFSGSPDHVAGLSFDGGATFQATGTWGSSSSGASHQDNVHFSGTGTLLVTTSAGVTLVSSLNPAVFGQAIVFTASVTGASGTPTGTVTFRNGATVLGMGTLDGTGLTTYTNSTLAAGTNSITATYGGDTTYSAVTSTNLSEVITTVVTRPVIVGVSLTAGGLVMNGTNGTPNAGFSVRSSTNVALPLTNWIVVTNGTFDSLGSFTVTNLINPNDSKRFYLLSTP